MPVEAAGVYSLSLWIREDGAKLDRLLLTTDTTYIPSGAGPAESLRYVSGEDLPEVRPVRLALTPTLSHPPG